MGLGLGIDAGGTATRWRLADPSGQCMAQGAVAPLTGHLFSAAAEERARQIVLDMAQAVMKQGRPLGIIAGITGLTRDTPAEATMRALFAETFELAPDKVFVAEDMWIAYLSYFALGEGILVYSGTGSIGYYLSEDKDVIRVGGRGNLIDDGGSGFWIAREALKAVLRAEEESPGAGWTTILGTCLAKALGGTDWNIVRSFVYGGDRGKIGSLARAVGEAAQAGDGTALTILKDAGEELARLANALIKRLGPRPVALVGGSARLHPLLSDSFRKQLVAPVEFIATDLDAALTAARLAATLNKV
ncbi:N-acetylglucosamine kinase [Microvirga lotononidis]|uniref:Putative N-acetylglucosamine kinase n=1 Tax=Microvirga lotononidis TaxID=864069 RepID=I4YM29_9HYPH|nr:BadF/BadG/BcrA/BcrD ATPase family protein [Microvirga lotononidis]EIM25021.1 putative N-acetylglucosamine kinase [Microvirga lotononidis]WQO29485.1 BadF/BadG/BcrA/BcrD ATPase family protein [Microvirga lotononidis]